MTSKIQSMSTRRKRKIRFHNEQTSFRWKKMGYSKGTLRYLKKNAKDNKPFKIYCKLRDKLLAADLHQIRIG